MLKNLILIQAIYLVFQIVLYFGCEQLQHRIHIVKRKVDDRIPFLPWTSVFYSLWFPMIAVFPILVYRSDPFAYCVYQMAMLTDLLLSVICYVFYPTSFKRPIPPDTFWGLWMKGLYKGSYKGLNCAPSLHCSNCFLVICISLRCTAMPLGLRLLFTMIAVSISASTLTTKQHVVFDVFTAVPVFLLSIFLGTGLAYRVFIPLISFIQ